MKISTQGFTLIELTLVLGLLAVIAGFGITMSYSSLSQAAVTQERDILANLLLRGIRSAAITNVHETSHGVRFDNTNHQYILFSGKNFDENPSSHEVVPYSSTHISVQNSAGESVVFEQLSGDVTTGAGVVTITNGEALQKITIREQGQIDW